jgi:hypothetical protein
MSSETRQPEEAVALKETAPTGRLRRFQLLTTGQRTGLRYAYAARLNTSWAAWLAWSNAASVAVSPAL